VRGINLSPHLSRQFGSTPALPEILGHPNVKLTLRYAYLAPDHLRAEIERTATKPAVVALTGTRR
jgi:hypothetical protein